MFLLYKYEFYLGISMFLWSDSFALLLLVFIRWFNANPRKRFRNWVYMVVFMCTCVCMWERVWVCVYWSCWWWQSSLHLSGAVKYHIIKKRIVIFRCCYCCRFYFHLFRAFFVFCAPLSVFPPLSVSQLNVFKHRAI